MPFTLGIQTTMQGQSMFAYGHNGVFSMDATFGTNDVEYYLFTYISFGAHRTKMPLALAYWQMNLGSLIISIPFMQCKIEGIMEVLRLFYLDQEEVM